MEIALETTQLLYVIILWNHCSPLLYGKKAVEHPDKIILLCLPERRKKRQTGLERHERA